MAAHLAGTPVCSTRFAAFRLPIAGRFVVFVSLYYRMPTGLVELTCLAQRLRLTIMASADVR